MAIESNRDELIPTCNESSYEERASEEEVYLEETEEELRSELISDTPQDDLSTSRRYSALDAAFESYREAWASLFSGMRITTDVASTHSRAHGHIL